jgi:CHAT domain-containing protein
MRRFFCFFFISFFLVAAALPVIGKSVPTAASLTQTGHQYLNQGQPETALQKWQEAERQYHLNKSQQGVAGSQINQSLALQQMGHYFQACRILVKTLKFDPLICSEPITEAQKVQLSQHINADPITLLAIQNLGEVLRQLNLISTAEFILEHTIKKQTSTTNNGTSNEYWLNINFTLANIYETKYRQSRQRFEFTYLALDRAKELQQGIENAEKALRLYELSVAERRLTTIAKINWIKLWTSVHKWTASSAKMENLTREKTLKAYLEQLNEPGAYNELTPIERIYARLTLAQTLLQTTSQTQLPQRIDWGIEFSKAALSESLKIGNIRAQSFAQGMLGRLFRQNSPTQAQQYFENALILANSIRAYDGAYQWQFNLAQLATIDNQLSKAIEYYKAAAQSLEKVRSQLPSDLQYTFRESILPIYQSYMDVLLTQAEPDWKEVFQINSDLRLREIENYLECNLPQFSSIDKLIDQTSVALSILDTGKRIEVLIRSNSQAYHYSVDRNKVVEHSQQLLFALRSPRFINSPPDAWLPHAQALYQSLIRPGELKGILKTNQTIIWLVDPILQGIPPALLHDGNQYLVEKYATTHGIGFEFLPAKSNFRRQNKALIAGITEPSPSLKLVSQTLEPLETVDKEVRSLTDLFPSTRVVLNEDFTVAGLQQQVTKFNPTIIHVSTHGTYSSRPDNTFLLAWDKPIDTRYFSSFLNLRQQAAKAPLDLLFLSACQSASGDHRSILGLAGLAAQSGATSTIATLWLVDADSTAELSQEFYQGLQQGLNKTEALRKAQLALMYNPSYKNPFFWAGIILVGSG